MRDLLFLSHRIPYPPNKGEKIRAFRFFERLAAEYRIHLGCFVDDPDDVRHESFLAQRVASSYFKHTTPAAMKAASVFGLLTGAPLSVAAFAHRDMKSWAADTIRRIRPAAAFVFSSAMAQYVVPAKTTDLRIVMDFVDVDSDKFRQYAGTAPWPLSAVYRREARTLLNHDRKVAEISDASIFVSEAEAEIFRKLAPESAHKTFAVSNGIDADFFAPRPDYLSPYAPGDRVLAFTGTMDYRPNVDAVVWFVGEILPLIRTRVPDVRFAIVGAKPAREVQALAGTPGVMVTGRVDDVRPFIAHAAAVVAPLRLARGIQNKVLEGMAMGKAVITTPQGLEGIDADDGVNIIVRESKNAFADAAIECLSGGNACNQLGAAARQIAVERYSWTPQLDRLSKILAGGRPE